MSSKKQPPPMPAAPPPPPPAPGVELTQRQIESIALTQRQINDALNRAIALVPKLSGMRRTCVDCQHFANSRELCTLVQPPARPPAQVIAYGCPSFEFDDIPF